MSVNVEIPVAVATANGVTTTFPHSFTVLSPGDLTVQGELNGVTTTYTLGTHYTLTGVGTNSGSVIFGTAPANGTIVKRFRNMSLSRATDYQDNGDLLADTVNLDFDRLWLAMQEIFYGAKGVPAALRAPAGETVAELPAAAGRAGYLLGFDGAGNPVMIPGQSGTASSLALDLASNTGAGMIGSVQSGAGATPRTTQAKLRDFFHPKDYGAAVDGITDDSAEIQAMLNAAAGKVCTILPGSYNMGATGITVPIGTTVNSHGAVLTWTSHCVGVTFAGSATKRGRWFGGKLVGVGGGAYVVGSTAIMAAGTDNSPLAPTYVLGPEVEGVEIDGWGEYGFFGAYLKGGHFRGSEGVKNCAYGGVCGVSCDDFKEYFNVISDIGPGSPGGDAYGTFFDRKDNPSETAQPRSYRCVIGYNIIKNVVATGGNGQGIDTHGGVGFSILGNHVLDCQAGIFITSSSISGAQALAPKHCTVVGNTVKSSLRVSYGIYVGGASNAGVVAEYAEGCVVSGNTVEGHGTSGVAVSGAIRLQATHGAVLEGNNVLRAACNGILLDPDNIGFSITGGSITDPYDNTYGSPNCILVAGNNNSGYIGGVAFNFRNVALATYVSVGSIRVNTGLTGLDLEFGRCQHIGLDASHLQYLPITTSGVNATGLAEQSGSNTLSAGVYTLTFPKRFPAVPKVMVTNTSDLSPIRVSAVSATGATFAGTGGTSFTWRASL